MSEGIYNIRPTEESKCPYTEEHCNAKELVNNNKLGKVKDIKTVCKQCEHYPDDKIKETKACNCNPEVIKGEKLTAFAGEETPLRNEIITKILTHDFIQEFMEYDLQQDMTQKNNEVNQSELDYIYTQACEIILPKYFKYGAPELTSSKLKSECRSIYNMLKLKRLDLDKITTDTKRILNSMDNGCYYTDETTEVHGELKCDKKEMVDHPDHYKGERKYEPIDVIEDWGLGFCDGNALKYISRLGRKDPNKTIEDIDKAIWYLNRLKQNLLSK